MDGNKFVYKKVLEKNKKAYLFMMLLMLVASSFFLGSIDTLIDLRNEKKVVYCMQIENVYDIKLSLSKSDDIEEQIKTILHLKEENSDLNNRKFISLYQTSHIVLNYKKEQITYIPITAEIAKIYNYEIKKGKWLANRKEDSDYCIPVVVSPKLSTEYEVGKTYVVTEALEEEKTYKILIVGVLENNYYLDLEYNPNIVTNEKFMIALNDIYQSEDIAYEKGKNNIVVRCLVYIDNKNEIDSLSKEKYVIEIDNLSELLSDHITDIEQKNMPRIILSIFMMMLTIIWNIIFTIYSIISLKVEIKVCFMCGAKINNILKIFCIINLKYEIIPAVAILIIYLLTDIVNEEVVLNSIFLFSVIFILLLVIEFIIIYVKLREYKSMVRRLDL